MKKHILISFCLLFSGWTLSQTFDTIMLHYSGPINNRINVVILGDGYDVSEQDTFITTATTIKDYFLNTPPYSAYNNYFNFIAIKVISNESGIKHPGTATDVTEPVFPVSTPDNYLKTSFDHQDIHRCVYSTNTYLTTQVLAANTPYYDEAVVLANSPKYGGCAGMYAFFTAHNNSKKIFMHEFGHSFANLADEYWYAPTGESVNKTQDGNPSTNKWRNWIGENGVDIYPFPEDTSWYRPHQNCIMQYLSKPFCSVCSEAIVERIHALVSPIDIYYPTNLTQQINLNDIDFGISLVLPNPNDLSFSWELNGVEINNQDTAISISPTDLNNGINVLNFSVVDTTSFVRTDNHENIHVNTVTWQIEKNLVGINDLKISESSFVLYPNPTNNIVYVKSNKKSTEILTFELLSLTGKVIQKRRIAADDQHRFLFTLEDLAPQTYLLKIYDANGSKLYTHRIIKK